MRRSITSILVLLISFHINCKSQDLNNPSVFLNQSGDQSTYVCLDTISKLSTMKVGERLRIKCLHYNRGAVKVIEDSKPLLDSLYAVMQQNPTLKIQIEGHICCTNDADKGPKSLSMNRAKTLYEYLKNKGINPNRMSYIGLGRTQPLVDPEITTADQNTNRRIEILVVEK